MEEHKEEFKCVQAKTYRDAMVKAFCHLMNEMEKEDMDKSSILIDNPAESFKATIAIQFHSTRNSKKAKKTEEGGVKTD